MHVKAILHERKNDSFYDAFEIQVNGKTVIYASAGEPEDRCIYRDQSYVFDILGLMMQARSADKFTYEEITVDDCED